MHQISDQWDTIGFFTILVFKAPMAKQDDYARYTIRVPQQLYAALDEAAAAANRSVNAEIVERLNYAVEHPPEEHYALLGQLQDLDDELEQVQTKYDEVARHADMMHLVNDHNFDDQKKMMYHILNYIDEIPIELSIWAYDLISAIERTELMSHKLENSRLGEEEIKEEIKIRREKHRRKIIEGIRQNLSERGKPDQD